MPTMPQAKTPRFVPARKREDVLKPLDPNTSSPHNSQRLLTPTKPPKFVGFSPAAGKHLPKKPLTPRESPRNTPTSHPYASPARHRPPPKETPPPATPTSSRRLVVVTPEKKRKDVWTPSPLAKRMYRVAGGISELAQSAAAELEDRPKAPSSTRTELTLDRVSRLNRQSWSVTLSDGQTALLVSPNPVDLAKGNIVRLNERPAATIGHSNVYFHWELVSTK